MASTDSSDQLLDLLDACKTYHRTTALAHLDTPPGAARDARLAEAMAQTESACSVPALQIFANLGANAPEAQRPAMRRLNAWGLGMHVQQRTAAGLACRAIPIARRHLLC